MRTYEILDADGVVLRVETLEASMAPFLFQGESKRLVAVDGEADHPEVKGEPVEPAPIAAVVLEQASAEDEASVEGEGKDEPQDARAKPDHHEENSQHHN